MHKSLHTLSKATGPLFYTLCLLCLHTLTTNTAFAGPSFSCDKATSYTERYICKNGNAEDGLIDAGIWELDNKLARTYKNFLLKLPSNKRELAKRIQSLWLRNRDYRCANYVYHPYSISGEGDYSDELDDLHLLALGATPSSSVGLCIKHYYRNAIASLEHGVLVGHLNLVPKISNYPIGVNGIEELVIKNKVSHPVKCADGHNNTSDVYLDTGKKLIPFGTIKDFYCDMSDYDMHLPGALTIYLTQNGDLLTAKRQVDDYTEKKCTRNVRVSLEFFRIEDGALNWYKGNGDNSVMLLEETSIMRNQTHTCGASDKGSSVAGWDSISNGIRFGYVKKSEPYVWSVFKQKTNVDVLTNTTEYSTVPPSDFSNAILATEKFNAIYSKLYHDNTVASFSGNDSICSPVIKGISNYKDLLYYVAGSDISMAHAFFLAEHDLDKLDISNMRNIIDKTADMFLLYLDKAREHSQWREDLVDFSIKHETLLSAYHAGRSSDIFMLKNKGYYSDTGCAGDESFRVLQLGTNTLENWIYLFWARRISDGTLDRTEKFLRTVKHVQ